MGTMLFISAAGAGAAPGNTSQVYWDQPGVSPIAGALSAQAMLPPNPNSHGVVGWWVWFATPPTGVSTVDLRLYRFRADPFFNYTLIADPFIVDAGGYWATILDLTSLLYPDAADFEASKNDVLALSVLVDGDPDMRALLQRVAFGV